MSSSIVFKEYDPAKETISQFLRRADEFKVNMQKETYALILTILNEIFKIEEDDKLTSILKFKNISEKRLLNDVANNKIIIKKYIVQVSQKLNIKFDVKPDTPDDKITDSYIIYFLEHILTNINYSLTSYTIKNKKYFSIKQKL
jgi:hypothetical protein